MAKVMIAHPPKPEGPAPVRFFLVGALAQSLTNFRGPLLQALTDAGCETHAAADSLLTNEAATAKLIAMNVKPHSIPLKRAGLNPLADLRALVAMVILLQKMRPDMMLSYTIKPVIWGTVAAWLTRVPNRYAMITGLGYAFNDEAAGKRALVQRLVKILYRFSLSFAHHVFFQNPDDLALFRELGIIAADKPVTVVNGSGVDLAHYAAAPQPNGPPTFLMISRLLGDKGVREFAAAARAVRQLHPLTEFHLVGGLDLNPDSISQNEVDEWVNNGDIIWHGAQSDVRPFIARAHVFVLPSYREGTPRTVLEALAIGRPVITTDTPGCRETVTDGYNGFLIPPRSINALVDAISKFLTEPERVDIMAKQSLALARMKYDAVKVAQGMLDVMGVGSSSRSAR